MMEQDRETLEREIEDTTRSLKRKIERLEETTLQKVEDVTKGVKLTAETIQKGVENLSLKRQMEKRPGALIAASIAAGILTGMRAVNRRKKAIAAVAAGPSLGKTLVVAAASQAAQSILPVVLGYATDWVERRLREKPHQPSNGTPKEDGIDAIF